MTLNRNLLFLIAAIVAFLVCFLGAIGSVSGVNFDAWLAAGLVGFAAAHLP